MAMQLTTNVLGAFIVKDKKMIMHRVFKADADKIAKYLLESRDSCIPQELELIKELESTGNKSVTTDNPSRFMGRGLQISVLQAKNRIPVSEIAAQLSIDQKDVDGLMEKVNTLMTRQSLRQIERDQVLIQAVNSLDDIDEAVNRLSERLREWYGLHFPELDEIAVSHRVYAQMVTDVGERGLYQSTKLGYEPNMNARIIKASKNSLGVDFSKEDIEAVKRLSDHILRLYRSKEMTEEYICQLMNEVAPNVSHLAGPVLGARLISVARGINRLATLPSGTIQILGAEDAFFRFLKTGKNPPKHGLIFQYPDIRGAKKGIRGKLARTLAAKIAIACRADAFGGEFMADGLLEKFQKRVSSLS